MCIGDWRFGRLIRSTGVTKTIAAGATFIIPESRQRVAFLLSYDASATIAFNSGGGFILTLFTQTLFCSLSTHGDLPTVGGTFTDGGAGGTLGFTEWYLPENMLTEALEEFQRQYQSRTPRY